MTSTATASTAAPGAARIPKFNPKLFPATGSAGAIAKPLWEMELDIISTWAKANKAMLPLPDFQNLSSRPSPAMLADLALEGDRGPTPGNISYCFLLLGVLYLSNQWLHPL